MNSHICDSCDRNIFSNSDKIKHVNFYAKYKVLIIKHYNFNCNWKSLTMSRVSNFQYDENSYYGAGNTRRKLK